MKTLNDWYGVFKDKFPYEDPDRLFIGAAVKYIEGRSAAKAMEAANTSANTAKPPSANYADGGCC